MSNNGDFDYIWLAKSRSWGTRTYLRVEAHITCGETHNHTCPVRLSCGAPTHQHMHLQAQAGSTDDHNIYSVTLGDLPLLADQRYAHTAAYMLSVAQET